MNSKWAKRELTAMSKLSNREWIVNNRGIQGMGLEAKVPGVK
jgi:hypothetical protein